jgi:type II secretory pathway pseudopilin PulG
MRTIEARGFTYLGLLAALALGGAALAALGTQWAAAAQRERERELQFRGEQIRRALERYWAAEQPPQGPPTLQALVADPRARPPRHHLRRLYADPLTGRADWILLSDPAGRGLVGVASRAEGPRYLAGAPARFAYAPPPAASAP